MCSVIDNVKLPEEVRTGLSDLSDKVKITQYSSKGANSHLFMGTHKILDIQIVVKFYFWGNDDAQHAEPRALASLNSDYVLKVLDADKVGEDWAYYIAPFHEQGDLEDYISKVPIGLHQAIIMTQGLLDGVGYLHSQKLMHRDLKPQNLLLSNDNRVVVGDLGTVCKIPDSFIVRSNSNHSLIYEPPEKQLKGLYGPFSDIYQIGITLYQLLGGHLPYDKLKWLNNRELTVIENIEDHAEKSIRADNFIREKIVKGKVLNLSSLPSFVPRDLRVAINKACSVDFNCRFDSCASFRSALNNALNDNQNWFFEDEEPTVNCGNYSFKVKADGVGNYYVAKKVGQGRWRRDNAFKESTEDNLVKEIVRKLKCL